MTRSSSLKSIAAAFVLAIACIAQASAVEPTMQKKMPAQAASSAEAAHRGVPDVYDHKGHAWGQRDPWGHWGDYYGPML
jgi:hypothetical protein